MKNEFKGTPGEWVADIRGGCAAIYPKDRTDDTPGCHSDDERNIAYSCKGAKFNGTHWQLDSSVEHDFMVMAAAPELLEALQQCIPHLREQSKNDGHAFGTLQLVNRIIAKALGETK